MRRAAFALAPILVLLASLLISAASAGDKPTNPQTFSTAKGKLLTLYLDAGQDPLLKLARR